MSLLINCIDHAHQLYLIDSDHTHFIIYFFITLQKGGDGTVYADLALSNTGGQAGYPGATNPSAVIYSDVNMK